MTEELADQLLSLKLHKPTCIESDTAHQYLLDECKQHFPSLPLLLHNTRAFIFGSFVTKAFFPEEKWIPSDINIMVPMRRAELFIERLMLAGYRENATLISRHLAPRLAWKETTYTKSYENEDKVNYPWRVTLTIYAGGFNSIELSKQLMNAVDIDVTGVQWTGHDNRFAAPCTLQQLLEGDWKITKKAKELQLFPRVSTTSIRYDKELDRRDALRLHVVQHLHTFEERGHVLKETSRLLFTILLEHKTARQVSQSTAHVGNDEEKKAIEEPKNGE